MTTLARRQPQLFPFKAMTTVPVKLKLLKNNVPVWLIEAGTEDVMRIEFVFRAGMEKEYLPLLAATTNMMLTEGSEDHISEELNRILDFYGVFLNLAIEKDTAGAVIFCLSRQLKKVLGLAQEILFRPVFPEKELEVLMKKRLRWFMVTREKVQNLAMDQFFESIFGSSHPYGRQVRENDFNGLIPAVLKDFHSKYYRPVNLAIIVSGKIPVGAFELLDSFFGEMESKEIYIEETENILRADAVKKISIPKPGAVQSAVRIGSATINKRHPDYPGLKILNVILGGYFGSRLMKNIREEKGYTYGIHSSINSLDLSGFKLISTEVGKENTQKAIDEIYKEIRLLQTSPVENDELQLVRNYMLGDMVRMFDGPFAMAESFKSAWEFGLDITYYERLAEKINSITPDELMSLANTYYKIEDLYEIVSG
jgi:zinc protease